MLGNVSSCMSSLQRRSNQITVQFEHVKIIISNKTMHVIDYKCPNVDQILLVKVPPEEYRMCS